ncbi:MAG: hypothetical protein [Podoviridae sp. cty5g4]|nr:MAG: hypothetical protein [Podoviridae sp. cty5g4]
MAIISMIVGTGIIIRLLFVLIKYHHNKPG